MNEFESSVVKLIAHSFAVSIKYKFQYPRVTLSSRNIDCRQTMLDARLNYGEGALSAPAHTPPRT